MAMNSHNSTQIASNELECMMQLAELYRGGMKMDEAVLAVRHSAPACKHYLEDVAYFCKMYSGGDSFPLLKCLDTHCKNHGHSLMLGEEMMNHLAMYDFRLPVQSMALTRIGLAAVMLISRKHADGFSRLLFKSDFDKLKGKDTTRKLDEMFFTLWKQALGAGVAPDVGYICWGNAAVRMVLHILNKEKVAKQEVYKSFGEIVELFSQELNGSVRVTTHSEPAGGSASAGSAVKDLLNCSSQEVALFQNAHIRIGDKYTHHDYPDQIFILKAVDDKKATFQHVPLFADALVVTEELTSLKKRRATKKEPTALCPAKLTTDRLPHNLEMVQKEVDKVQATALLMEAYMNNKVGDGVLAFVSNPSNLAVLKKVKKKEIKLFPMGTCSLVPVKDQTKILEKAKHCVAWYKTKPYQIQPFKSFNNFAKPEETGTLCPYYWVRSSGDDEEISLKMAWVEYRGLHIPILENEEPIEPKTLLLKSSDPDEVFGKGPSAKKAKTA
ncbi:unnamed protein product [Durusdinium trenchii]|uniref:Uncharacterized protein n=1 Tax=Durusdinium trenchii TaxID=1381693 RepID=A0ABP0HH55_9DINO